MEIVTMFFMIVSVIYMALIYLRLRDIVHNVTANANLIIRDIVDHDSHINKAVSDCALQVSDMEKNLTTEIACLATKNNEDIKRMGGKFEQWDLIELDGERWVIHRIDKNVNGDTFYRVHNAEGQITNVSGKAMQKATFVKHVSSPFEE